MTEPTELWGHDEMYMSVRYCDDGAIQFEGQNLHGEGEYEYALTVAAEDTHLIFEALGGKPGEPVVSLLVEHSDELEEEGVEAWLKRHKIGSEFWSRIEL